METDITRINVGIDPAELPTKMLIAEHREIKRIPNCIKSGRYNLDGMPEKFTLGTGHVKFFYDKIQYLRTRYIKIYKECVRRDFNVTCYIDCFKDIPIELYNDYVETPEDRQLLIERLLSKGVNIS